VTKRGGLPNRGARTHSGRALIAFRYLVDRGCQIGTLFQRTGGGHFQPGGVATAVAPQPEHRRLPHLGPAVPRAGRAAAGQGGRPGRPGQDCPFDLHALLPVPDAILGLGPTHPEALVWLASHWGVTDRLREAFATAMEAALADRTGERTTELGRWGGWLVIAATLALRSRLLLPGDTPEARAAEDEAEALRRRLVSRAQVRVVADWLERRPQLGRDVFGCGTGQRRHDNGRVGDITELLRACLVALDVPAQAEVYRPRPPTLWQVSDAIAGLELARAGVVALDRDAPWTPIRVLHRDDHSAVQGAVGPLA
jgi:hypothetical protein